MYILYGILIFWAGLITGYIFVGWRLRKFSDYSGVIHVEKDVLTEKTVYTLELSEYPEKLEFKKVVVFKVDHRE